MKPPALGIEIEVVNVSSVPIGTTTAAQTSIVDSGNYFSSGNVEGALQEVGLKASFVKDAILSFQDYAAASAAAATLPDGQHVTVERDAGNFGLKTQHRAEGGSLVFVSVLVDFLTPEQFGATGSDPVKDTAAFISMLWGRGNTSLTAESDTR